MPNVNVFMVSEIRQTLQRMEGKECILLVVVSEFPWQNSHRRNNLENSIPSNNKLIMWSNRIKIAVLLLRNYPSTCQDNFPPYTLHTALQYTLPFNTNCPTIYTAKIVFVWHSKIGLLKHQGNIGKF